MKTSSGYRESKEKSLSYQPIAIFVKTSGTRDQNRIEESRWDEDVVSEHIHTKKWQIIFLKKPNSCKLACTRQSIFWVKLWTKEQVPML